MYCTAIPKAKIADTTAHPRARCFPEHIANSPANDIAKPQTLPSNKLLHRNSIEIKGTVLLAARLFNTRWKELPRKSIELVANILQTFQQ
jgi:hypothetical protein